MHKKTKIAEYGIIIKDNKFLMLQFSKKTNPTEKWIFPGGRMNANEKPKQALKREIKEETGLEVEIKKPIDVLEWGEKEDNRYAIFFKCKHKKGKVRLSKEHQNYKWYTFKELNKIDYYQKEFKEILKKAK
ncbi:hypothetical protein DRJ22_00140 [Candidatus Woesearchaeota archaeon]|nr:MAG: hypothetical protein B6U93_03050 [Candidatus Woesearchaeota archaeon ex4484_78]RLE47120.1 MAG: hypothetical protein DRJ22_00140 [Candidatus Woesearchaeota archaeon]